MRLVYSEKKKNSLVFVLAQAKAYIREARLAEYQKRKRLHPMVAYMLCHSSGLKSQTDYIGNLQTNCIYMYFTTDLLILFART